MTRDTLRGNYRDIIGESPRIFEVLQQIERFAVTSMKVLISGETGTGKELVARAQKQRQIGRTGFCQLCGDAGDLSGKYIVWT